MSTTITIRPHPVTAEHKVRSAATGSVWLIPDTWAALIPLLFLVVRGTFSFEGVDTNVPNGGVYGSMLSASALNGARHIVEIVVFYAIMCALCLPWYKIICKSFLQNWLLTAIPVVALLSTVWSAVPSRSFAFSIMALVNTAFGIYLAKRYSRAQLLELFIGLGVIALVLSFLLVAVYPAAGLDHKENMPNAWEGLFGHKNHCAMIMLLLLIPAFHVKASRGLPQILRALYVVATISLIVMTTARTGWILLMLALFFVPFVRLLARMRQKDRFVLATLVISVSLIVSLVGLYEASNIALMLGKDPTFSGRTDIWKAVLRPIFKHPYLGYGYYAFWTKANPEALATALAIGSTGLGNAENGVLQMWLEMGALGLGLLFLALAHLCKMGMACFRKDHSGFIQWSLCMVFLSLLYGLLAGDKFMFPHTIEWTILVLVYVCMHDDLQRLRQPRSRKISYPL
ncbi:Exopolysaccharide production protein ExoQ [Acidisarcina polymorpha]|uniref:Exopolysaccharide production protein ExoQ n=1 Tax=Acidisarcina polymorpha TaxID=2211140 RepID=A0A2Z5G2W3_9BACT|nr:O-antigen ligase family protein [Acidisarcina polymorpha]AXC12975.1 Exopolysaccharide production protein ExoQ [Acidisarcina polymorpha]